MIEDYYPDVNLCIKKRKVNRTSKIINDVTNRLKDLQKENLQAKMIHKSSY